MDRISLYVDYDIPGIWN